jgi:hypothetical protein
MPLVQWLLIENVQLKRWTDRTTLHDTRSPEIETASSITKDGLPFTDITPRLSKRKRAIIYSLIMLLI